MDDILIITASYDIPIAEEYAQKLDKYRVLFFDPTLVDTINASQLRNTELVVWDACPDYPALVKAGHAQANSFERALQESVGSLLPAGTSLFGWQHLNLYYFFTAFDWYNGLWRDVLARLKDHKVHVFLNDNPSSYYWPSFMPALLLLQQLRTWRIAFAAQSYGQRPDESSVVLNLDPLTPATECWDVVTHVPTCFYDAPYFSAELQAAGKRSLDLIPKYWGVTLETTARANLLRLADQRRLYGEQPPLAELDQALTARLDQLLQPYIATPDFRARQARQLSNLYQSQLVSLHMLEGYFAQHKPGKLLLSDHDSGYHGPLVSFAARHRLPVLVVPHAKTSDDTEFCYDGITMLTHPIQGLPLYDGCGKRLLQHRLGYAEEFSARSTPPLPLKKVGLLLNGLSLNGVQCTAWAPYLEGIRQIDSWCREQGLELAVRCRQGQSLVELLSGSTGITRETLLTGINCSLQAFADSVDLCLMYDAPTNADIEFLRKGIPIVNPVPAPLGKAEAATADIRVVPRDSVAGILALLDTFVADSNNLHAFRLHQFADYVGLFRNSYALRQLL